MTTPQYPPPPPPPGWHPPGRGPWPPRKPKGNLAVILIPLVLLGGGLLVFIVFAIAVGMVFGSSSTTPTPSPAAETPRTIASYTITPTAAPPAPTTAAVNTDEVFIASLQRVGMTIKNRNSAIAAGHAACVALDAGNTVPGLLNSLMSENGFSAEDAGHFLGISVAAYCPEHRGLIESS